MVGTTPFGRSLQRNGGGVPALACCEPATPPCVRTNDTHMGCDRMGPPALGRYKLLHARDSSVTEAPYAYVCTW